MSKTISNGVFHHISLIPINCLIITLRSSLHIDPPNQQHQWPTRSTYLSQWPQDQVYLDIAMMDIICDYLQSPIPITTRSSTPKNKTLASTNVKCQPLLAPYNNRLIQIWIISKKKKQKIVNHIQIVHCKGHLWAFQCEPLWRISGWVFFVMWCSAFPMFFWSLM